MLAILYIASFREHLYFSIIKTPAVETGVNYHYLLALCVEITRVKTSLANKPQVIFSIRWIFQQRCKKGGRKC
jgi:hypothetical protein